MFVDWWGRGRLRLGLFVGFVGGARAVDRLDAPVCFFAASVLLVLCGGGGSSG